MEKIISISKYEQVANILRDEIKHGKFSPKSRFYSESILCERFGVTHVTIRNALIVLQDEGLIVRIHGKGTFISEKDISKGTLGILVWKGKELLHHPSFSELMRGVAETVADSGFKLNLIFITPSILENKQTESLIVNSNLDGLIVPVQQISLDDILPLKERLKIVFVEQKIPLISKFSICSNTVLAYYNATKFLLDQGHRKIGLVYAGSCKETNKQILLGYNKAMKEFQLSVCNDLILRGEIHSEEEGKRLTEILLSSQQPPTAILAGDDSMAVGAMKAAEVLGLKIPEDLSIIGHNDMYLSVATNPPLSTVQVPYYEMGKHATCMLIDIIKGKEISEKAIVLDSTLIVRQSCQPPQK